MAEISLERAANPVSKMVNIMLLFCCSRDHLKMPGPRLSHSLYVLSSMYLTVHHKAVHPAGLAKVNMAGVSGCNVTSLRALTESKKYQGN